MPQTRRTVYTIVGSALCLGSVLVFYAAVHQWLPLLMSPSAKLGHRPNLALIALLGVVALAGGINFLAKAFLPRRASQRTVSFILGVALCVTAVLGLVYAVQGWPGSISRDDPPFAYLAWAVLGVVSLVVLLAGARLIYDARRGAEAAARSGARHTPQRIV
jgi:uncharacterized membrane protein YidH (DUF202 family)